MTQEKEKAQSEQKTAHVETWQKKFTNSISELVENEEEKAMVELVRIYLETIENKHPDKSPTELLNMVEKVELHSLKEKHFLFPEADSNTSYINYKIHFPDKIPTHPTRDVSQTGYWEIGIKDGNGGENVWLGNFANRGALHRFVHFLETLRNECDRILNFIQIYN
jgi:hypothetical protein